MRSLILESIHKIRRERVDLKSDVYKRSKRGLKGLVSRYKYLRRKGGRD